MVSFTPRTLAFLRALQRNNRREWFQERREHIAAHFPHRLLPKNECAGLYLEVSPRHVWMGGGSAARASGALGRSWLDERP